jgi:hypothetical protein
MRGLRIRLAGYRSRRSCRHPRLRLLGGRGWIAGLVVASGFDGVIFDCGAGAVPLRRRRSRRIRLTLVITAQLIGLVFVDRAGVSDFFRDPEFVQLVDDLARLYFQLPRQFIDSNLTHI